MLVCKSRGWRGGRVPMVEVAVSNLISKDGVTMAGSALGVMASMAAAMAVPCRLAVAMVAAGSIGRMRLAGTIEQH